MRKPEKWNTHNPDEYEAKLKALDGDALLDEVRQAIWLSAYANNNPRSDYHWMCDMAYDFCKERGTPEIYTKAHAQLVAETRGY